MAEHDLTSRIAPHLDRHLVFPLLEFHRERQLYANEEILKAKIDLLSQTNMVDYAMDIHKILYHTEEIPQEMMERRTEVVGRLKSLEESAAPLISFLQNPANAQELRLEKLYNLQMLNDRFQIGQEQIEALYQYAKFQFDCGNYSGAADYLYHYRDLCTNSDRSLSALWGKLAAEILMQNWAIALEELNRLKQIIDSKNFASPLYQLQNRIWLMHWSLFIFFNHENGRNGIIDLFFQDRYLNAIQTNANHLLRYVATAVIVSKRRWNMIKELIKVIQQENHVFKDPITEFLECLYINHDFEGAQHKLQECEHVILNVSGPSQGFDLLTPHPARPYPPQQLRSGSFLPSKTYHPSLDTATEEQQTKAGDSIGCFVEITPNLCMDEPMKQEQIATMDHLLEVSNALPPPHLQQTKVKSIYNDKEHFLPPIPSTVLTGYPNMNASMGIGGLNQGV
ncbi:eukaryotic translation initiation factor 3 subunit E-like [Dendrobium catenatum]|uniref:eukaryotic translation initiation factor 3 subunit E-like n=1 Tax=Dendrobium catenatum TaxID=906689 RepID=UPI00109FC999|nr:eukaryotic translation initiation factor 3 subunit E-like [Dendrobium catenatum]